MLLGRLPSDLTRDLPRGLHGLYGGAGLDPALVGAFLGRFGPYRLQPYAVPMLPPSQISAPWFQPHGLPDTPPTAPVVLASPGRGGGNGRGGGGPRSADRRGGGGYGSDPGNDPRRGGGRHVGGLGRQV